MYQLIDRHKIIFISGILLSGLMLVQSVNAQETQSPISPLAQELFLSETPFVQDTGETQIGFSFGHFILDDTGNLNELSMGVEYGLTDTLTLGFAIPYLSYAFDSEFSDDPQGLGDASIGLAYALLNRRSTIVTLAAEYNLTTGDEAKGLGEDESSWGINLTVAHALADAQLIFGIGSEFADENSFQYGLALTFPMLSNIAILELQATQEKVTEANVKATIDNAYFVAGMLFDLENSAEFQIGVPVGLTDDSFDWGLILSWNIEFD